MSADNVENPVDIVEKAKKLLGRFSQEFCMLLLNGDPPDPAFFDTVQQTLFKITNPEIIFEKKNIPVVVTDGAIEKLLFDIRSLYELGLLNRSLQRFVSILQYAEEAGQEENKLKTLENCILSLRQTIVELLKEVKFKKSIIPQELIAFACGDGDSINSGPENKLSEDEVFTFFQFPFIRLEDQNKNDAQKAMELIFAAIRETLNFLVVFGTTSGASEQREDHTRGFFEKNCS